MLTEHAIFDFTPQLDKIHCKILYLVGEEDPVHPVASAVETANYLKSNCQLTVIKNTGDPVYRDKPDETYKIIIDFLHEL